MSTDPKPWKSEGAFPSWNLLVNELLNNREWNGWTEELIHQSEPGWRLNPRVADADAILWAAISKFGGQKDWLEVACDWVLENWWHHDEMEDQT